MGNGDGNWCYTYARFELLVGIRKKWKWTRGEKSLECYNRILDGVDWNVRVRKKLPEHFNGRQRNSTSRLQPHEDAGRGKKRPIKHMSSSDSWVTVGGARKKTCIFDRRKDGGGAKGVRRKEATAKAINQDDFNRQLKRRMLERRTSWVDFLSHHSQFVLRFWHKIVMSGYDRTNPRYEMVYT